MTGVPTTSVLRLEQRDCALFATIDDPSTRNAMSDALLTDLEAVFAHHHSDPAIRALVLLGNERVFCAGADLGGKTLTASTGDPRSETIDLSLRGAAVYGALAAFPKPVIAVVEGAAMGGGMGLAACADIVLAGPAAKFALSEARLGLVAAQIAPFVVSRIGLATTRRLALTGSRFDAGQAVSFGLVDEMLPDRPALDARVAALLSEIRSCAPNALAATKSLLSTLSGIDMAVFTHNAANVFADAAAGDGAEGIAAFKQKRQPSWATA